MPSSAGHDETSVDESSPTPRAEPSGQSGRPQHKFDGKEMAISIASTLVFDIGLSIFIFQLAQGNGAGDVASYLWSSIGPLVGLAVEFIRHRRIDSIGLVVLGIIVLSALISVIGSTDPKVLLLKDSVFTGAIGVVILLSLTPLFRRPLMWYMGRKFGTDGTDAGVAYWESLWQYAGFRHSQRMITGVWGAGFVIEAVLKTLWVLALPFDTAYVLNQIAPLAVTAVLMGWTIWYAGKVRRAGEERARRLGEGAQRQL